MQFLFNRMSIEIDTIAKLFKRNSIAKIYLLLVHLYAIEIEQIAIDIEQLFGLTVQRITYCISIQQKWNSSAAIRFLFSSFQIVICITDSIPFLSNRNGIEALLFDFYSIDIEQLFGLRVQHITYCLSIQQKWNSSVAIQFLFKRNGIDCNRY